MEKRVVVTGLGAVTPLGNDVKTTWENMKKGVNGIDTVTKFDASGYKCTFAGEVRGFDPTLYMPKGEVRKTDLYCQYAVAAATQAYEDSGLTAEERRARPLRRLHRFGHRRHQHPHYRTQ